jgi:hypothetical protein
MIFRALQSENISGNDLVSMVPDDFQNQNEVEVTETTDTYEYHAETQAGLFTRFHLIVTYDHLFYKTTKHYKTDIVVDGLLTPVAYQYVTKDLGYRINKDNTYVYISGIDVGLTLAFSNLKAATGTRIEGSDYEYHDFE